MRRSICIPLILILFTLSVELCSSCGAVAAAKGTSHLVCVLDDRAELKLAGLGEAPALMVWEMMTPAGWTAMLRWEKAELPPPEMKRPAQTGPGVRRHRWLCRERC